MIIYRKKCVIPVVVCFFLCYDKDMKKKVIVGMSGGVDSSVAAFLLKEQGYDVIGLFMHNWKETDDNGCCTAEDDYTDVRRVCDKIGIPYYSVDFSEEYYSEVFSHFVDEYKKGRTPNPDILCNSRIKFGAFRDRALSLGAEYLATGHYCGVERTPSGAHLLRAFDENKDQTYFLNQVSKEQISNVLFPLSDLPKPEVRKIAEKIGLSTAYKKDSTGVCFIGERNFRRFLAQYIPMKEGEIRTLDGKIVGKHEGVYYYTIGQHKGFGVGGIKGEKNENPWYVVRKDVVNNILYVHQGEVPEMYTDVLTTEKFHFINESIPSGSRVLARIRHRQPLQSATVYFDENGEARVEFDQKQRAVTGGQYCVLYDGRICLGGGCIK